MNDQPKSEIRRGEPTGEVSDFDGGPMPPPKPTGEWTVTDFGLVRLNGKDMVTALTYDQGKALVDAINVALNTKDDGGQRDEWFKALTTITKLEHQLAAAQLAIANHNRDNNNANGTCYKIKADTTALDAALAAAQQPLTECLNWLREELKGDEYYVEKIDIAFAKVKEPQ